MKKKKKKRIKKKNGIAKALQHPSFKQQVIPDKRRAYHVSELSDEDIEAVRNAKYPEGFEHLNSELND